MGLVPLTFKRGEIEPILSLIASSAGRSINAQEIMPGAYIIGHWNPEYLVREKFKDWNTPGYENIRFVDREGNDFPEYGVCDSPEQLFEKIDLTACTEKVAVFFVPIERALEPPQGGWRFHKWGEYVGNHEIQHEYLYDETGIDRVYTFHIYCLL